MIHWAQGMPTESYYISIFICKRDRNKANNAPPASVHDQSVGQLALHALIG